MPAAKAADEPAAPEAASERPFPLRTGVAEVVAVERPTPRMARITLGGTVVAGFPDEEPGEILTLIWPALGRDDVVLPLAGWRFPPGTPEQHARNYSIRAYDPHRPAVTIDVVLHGDGGQGSRWAGAVLPGDTVAIAGPRVHYETVPDADWTLLAGDETALPSIAATIERLPAGHPVVAFVEVADAHERQDLCGDAALTLTWVDRQGVPAGRGHLLERAVRDAELPSGDPKVWVAGEALVVRRLREYLRDERGYAIGPMQAIGYWKHRDTPDDVE